jgi:hypothetical protein
MRVRYLFQVFSKKVSGARSPRQKATNSFSSFVAGLRSPESNALNA